MTGRSRSTAPAVGHQDLRSALVITGQEIARYQALIIMLRAELRSLRVRQLEREAAGDTRDRRPLSRRALARVTRPVRGLVLQAAVHLVTHGDSRLMRRVHPVVVRLLTRYGRRWPLNRLFPWLADLTFSSGAEPQAGTRGQGPGELKHELSSLRRDLDHTRALASLLQAEVRLLRTGRIRRAPVADWAPEDLARDGVVVPSDGMVPRLAGRVRITATPGALPMHPQGAVLARPSVTVAVRFHDTREMPSLERCLYALLAQRDVDLGVLVMYQGSDQVRIGLIESMIDGMWLGERRPRVVSVAGPERVDRRARLLNQALEIHYGETPHDFFFVLDHDDVIFSHALATMAGPIMGTDAAMNFGKVLVARYLSFQGYEFLYRMDDFFKSTKRDLAELLVDNFFPIHAYIYNTRAMPPGYLRFDESMDRLEDYECLYRVVSAFPASMQSMDELVGLYCWKDERAIRGPIAGSSDRSTDTWDRNRRSLAKTMIAVASQPIGSD